MLKNVIIFFLWVLNCIHKYSIVLTVWKLQTSQSLMSHPGGVSGIEPTCQCRRPKKHRFNPWIFPMRKIPWRRAWQPTAVFLLAESHGQRSLESCSHRVAKSQTWLSNFTHKEFSKKCTDGNLPFMVANMVNFWKMWNNAFLQYANS